MSASTDLPVHVTLDGPADGPPLVLLASLGSDASMWRPQVRALRDTHRIIRVDARGHGRSSAPPGPYRLADLGGDVIAVLDDLGIAAAHVCGVSLGGQTALWLAIHHPDRLLSLTAANTAAKVGSSEGWQARIDAVRTHGLAGIRDDVLARFFAPGFADADPDGFAEAQQAFTTADDAGYAACCAALAGADLRQEVGRITVSTLVIGGDVDVATPPTDAQWLHQAIPDSRLLILDDAGHLSNLDQPERFTAALAEHIASTHPTTSQPTKGRTA